MLSVSVRCSATCDACQSVAHAFVNPKGFCPPVMLVPNLVLPQGWREDIEISDQGRRAIHRCPTCIAEQDANRKKVERLAVVPDEPEAEPATEPEPAE